MQRGVPVQRGERRAVEEEVGGDQCSPKSAGSWGTHTRNAGSRPPRPPLLLQRTCRYPRREQGGLSVRLYWEKYLRAPTPGCERLEARASNLRKEGFGDWTPWVLHKGILDLSTAVLSLFS